MFYGALNKSDYDYDYDYDYDLALQLSRIVSADRQNDYFHFFNIVTMRETRKLDRHEKTPARMANKSKEDW